MRDPNQKPNAMDHLSEGRSLASLLTEFTEEREESRGYEPDDRVTLARTSRLMLQALDRAISALVEETAEAAPRRTP